MFARILRKFGDAEEKICFDNLMKAVRTICIDKQGEEKQAALDDLQKIVLRPVQDEFIRGAYLYPEDNSSTGADEKLDFFSCLGLRQSQLDRFGATYRMEADFEVNLSSSLVFTKVLSSLNADAILGTIGTPFRRKGDFKATDSDKLLWIEPFGFGFAMGGELHIAMGILSGEGTIKPYCVLDLTECLPHIRYDGAHFLNEDNTLLGKPITPEFGWAWEIQKRGRLGPPSE